MYVLCVVISVYRSRGVMCVCASDSALELGGWHDVAESVKGCCGEMLAPAAAGRRAAEVGGCSNMRC